VFIQPIVGVAVAVAWLNESLHWGQLWGSLVILAGLIVGLWRPSG
jgi:drug/metabolite transporter (DMT)-like permease